MAILLNDQLDSSIILIESNGKKAAFLRNVLADLAGRARIAPERAETVISAQPAPDVVTARAVAPLRDLLTLTEPWMEAGTRALFHKGRDFRSEVKSASDTWNLDLVEHRSAVDPLSVVLEIDRIRRV